MAGTKGHSGRKTKFEEGEMIDVLNSSLKIIRDFFSATNIPLKDKAMVAKDFVLKKIPTRLQGEGFADIRNTIIYNSPDRKNADNTAGRLPVEQG